MWAGYNASRAGVSVEPPAGPSIPVIHSSPAVVAATRPSFDGLQASVVQLLHGAGATGSVTLIELGGQSPQAWAYQGDQEFVAASTYKLPLLMMEAQNVTAGRSHGIDSLCY